MSGRYTPDLFVGLCLSWPGWAQSSVLGELTAPSAACCSLHLAGARGPSLGSSWVAIVRTGSLEKGLMEHKPCHSSHELVGTKLIPHKRAEGRMLRGNRLISCLSFCSHQNISLNLAKVTTRSLKELSSLKFTAKT